MLQRKKFGWSRDEARGFVEELALVADRVKPAQAVDVIKADPSDNRLLECAAAARSDYLVTGDKHLLQLGRYGQSKIVTPAEFIEVMQGRGR